MKTYLADIIDTIERYSKKLDDVTVLKNTHWRLVDEESGARIVYIFRNHNELLISKNGAVERGRWEYLGNDSVLIEIANKAHLFKQGFYNNFVLGLQKDGTNEYAVLINEEEVEQELKSLEDLSYISSMLKSAHSIGREEEKEVEIDEEEIYGGSEINDQDKAILFIFILISIIAVLYHYV